MYSLCYYLKQRNILINLIVSSLLWLSANFGFYLILSLVNKTDEIYISGIVSSASEIIAYIISGLLYQKIGVKFSLMASFIISTMGGVLILTYGLGHEDSLSFFCFFLSLIHI